MCFSKTQVFHGGTSGLPKLELSMYVCVCVCGVNKHVLVCAYDGKNVFLKSFFMLIFIKED